MDTGRRGPCIPCIAKREADNEFERIRKGLAEEQRKENERKNPKLF